MHDKLEINVQEFASFIVQYLTDKSMHNKRIGQGMYDHFKLDKCTDQSKLQELYYIDDDNVFEFINDNFIIKD